MRVIYDRKMPEGRTLVTGFCITFAGGSFESQELVAPIMLHKSDRLILAMKRGYRKK